MVPGLISMAWMRNLNKWSYREHVYSLIDSIGINDVYLNSRQFTWSNLRGGVPSSSKQDKFLVPRDWLENFKEIWAERLVRNF